MRGWGFVAKGDEKMLEDWDTLSVGWRGGRAPAFYASDIGPEYA